MKKYIIILLALIGTLLLYGCQIQQPNAVSDGFVSENIELSLPDYQLHETLKKVDPVGQIPEKLKNVVENNLFRYGSAFEECFLKTEVMSQDAEARTHALRVFMLDLYGNELASYTVSVGDAYHVNTLTATEDGGFLFVLGFRDHQYSSHEWASDNGYASRILKCNASGELQFDISLENIPEKGLSHCIEKDGYIYLFGESYRSRSDRQTDIFAVKLSQSGEVLKTCKIGGTDFDFLEKVDPTEGGFLLSVRAQSKDGDFHDPNSKDVTQRWSVDLNEELAITAKEKVEDSYLVYRRVGVANGVTLYDNDPCFEEYDAGNVDALLDYGDFYLVVSENRTGYVPTPPEVSSFWYTTETVYTGYSHDGTLLFRATADNGSSK